MRLLPRTDESLDDLWNHAQLLEATLPHLDALLDGGAGTPTHSEAVRALEIEGNRLLGRVAHALRETFITPLDRDDLHRVAHRVDDVLDAVDAVAFRLSCYREARLDEPGRALAATMRASVRAVAAAMTHVPHKKRRREHLVAACAEIGRLERAADDQLREALIALFAVERDAATLIQRKDLYELFEAVTDRAWEVAEALEDMLLDD